MSLYSFNTKTVIELRHYYKDRGYKLPPKPLKQELINGLILQHVFKEMKYLKMKRLERLEEEFNSGDQEDREDREDREEEVQKASRGYSEDDILTTLHEAVGSLHGNQTFTWGHHTDRLRCRLYNEHLYEMRRIPNSGTILGKHGEKILFHGTGKGSVESILEHDFSLNGDPVHGTVYGKGIYFTPSLTRACKYSKDKHFIVCRVHVGDVTRGNRDMVRLPKMECGKLYDSAVDSVDTPDVIVKFKNTHYDILGVLVVSSDVMGQDGRVPCFCGGFFGGSCHPNLKIRYKVLWDGCVIRASAALDSAKVGNLNKWEVIEVTAKQMVSGTTRVKFDRGWVSVVSKSGNTLLELVRPSTIDPVRRNIRFNNSTEERLNIYYKPPDKCVYKDPLSDLKLMGNILKYHSFGLSTKVGHEFVFATKDCIIRVFKVTKESTYIDISYEKCDEVTENIGRRWNRRPGY